MKRNGAGQIMYEDGKEELLHGMCELLKSIDRRLATANRLKAIEIEGQCGFESRPGDMQFVAFISKGEEG